MSKVRLKTCKIILGFLLYFRDKYYIYFYGDFELVII